MDLPVIKIKPAAASDADLARFFHKTEVAWTQHLGEERELDIGLAYSNAALARVHHANRILGAMLPPGADVDALLDEVDSHFRSAGVTCWRWSMNPSAAPDQTRPIIDALERRSHTRTSLDLMHLTQSVDLRFESPNDLQVIPARASYRHTREFSELAAAEAGEPQFADASMAHMDDPHYDLLIALQAGVPVARGGVLTAGDIGLIEDIYVAAAARGRGLGRLIMLRCLEICARSLFRHIILSVAPQNTTAIALYHKLGFRKFGEFVEWVRPKA